MPIPFLAALATAASFALTGDTGEPRRLTFQDRVEAQRAIERVNYAHQIGAVVPFEQAVPDGVLEQKVRSYLRQSALLGFLWDEPITGRALEAELQRILTGTRSPERLNEILDALGNDMFLARETLARATLADRRARDRFAQDERIHAATRQAAGSLRARLARGELSPLARHPARMVIDLLMAPEGRPPRRLPPDPRQGGGVPPGVLQIELEPDEFARWRSGAPAEVMQIGEVEDQRQAFVIRVVLEEAPGRVRLAAWTFPKLEWDVWWRGFPDLEIDEVGEARPVDQRPVTRPPETPLPAASVPRPATHVCGQEDVWSPISRPDAPGGGPAVWSGSEMIVWDGVVGGRYAPAPDTWAETSPSSSPAERVGHTVIWTGTLMAVWGGLGQAGYLDDGALYDPATDTWTPIASTGAPAPRYLHTAVWTGAEMIVWGGGIFDPDREAFAGFDTGGHFNPITRQWTPTATAGAPAGSLGHAAVWSGTEMIVWGGHDSVAVYHGTGGRYDPAAGSWRGLMETGAPTPRWLHTALWTGSEMIVWGGNDGFSFLDSGGRFDPAGDSWRPLSTVSAPEPRSGYSAVWTGRSMIVWGGVSGDFSRRLDTGGRYDAAADAWFPTTMTAAPEARSGHAAVWTGQSMIVWGGWNDQPLATGAMYSIDAAPETDNDGDGFTACGGDCADDDPAVHPEAIDFPGNLIDEDCDGSLGACDPTLSFRNRGQFLRCVVLECHALAASGSLPPRECRRVLRGARATWQDLNPR